LSSYRVLYVNGEIPFEEAKCVVFPYSGNWYVHTLFDGLPIRLKSGDVITMEATTGPAQDLLMMVNKTVYELSSIYRKIIGVTTVNPDSFRDYNLEKEIPTLLDDLAQGREYLTEIMDMIVDLMGIQSSQSANLEQFISLLDKVIYSPFLLPENLSSYKSRLDAMAALIWMFNDQEVEVDVGYVKSADMPEVKSNPGFFTRFWFGLRRLYYSFVISYRDVDYGENESGGKQIKVWVAAGRDQSQVMSRLITDTFTPQTGINVTLNLIGSGEPLIQAIMAGRAPDAVVLQTSENIINLAIRGALADLTQWGLTQEIRDRCYPASWVPFTYRGAVYAMPETINYSLLYYRKDVFEELGLSVPQTWDEFYEIIKTLQNHNLTVAMPETDPAAPAISIGISFFDTFLFQRGGRYFNEDYSRTMFDSQEAMEAFEEWVNLYKKYGLDKQLDVYSRVRSGEAPMVIWGQNAYAVLNGIAPELAGLLDIAPIPGRLREDGTIDRSTVASGSGAIVLKLTESRGVAKEAFEFVSWWTSPEVQAAYGLENESIIGITARHYPAQIAAFEMIGWTAAEAAVLKEQWGWVHGVPLVPGSYLIGRSLTSALRSAMDSTYETRRALAIYNRDINYEIERKTREFEQNYE
ncbi:MAG: extracellular solute-binding protein, partial [Defluviitaleaceae bacterium]|nr:extracellular solute-binding protein [Defluviitaleaceae bacterium]